VGRLLPQVVFDAANKLRLKAGGQLAIVRGIGREQMLPDKETDSVHAGQGPEPIPVYPLLHRPTDALRMIGMEHAARAGQQQRLLRS
jgi:hypothetical protein